MSLNGQIPIRKLAKQLWLLLLVLVILLPISFISAMTLENRDAFCASCYTEPESSYYQFTLENPAHDLAVAHSQTGVRCIDSHSGRGVLGRISAVVLGINDLVEHATSIITRPAVMRSSYGVKNYIKCHGSLIIHVGAEFGEGRSVDSIRGHDRHYVSSLLTSRSDRSGIMNVCTICHQRHTALDMNSWRGSVVIKDGCDKCRAVFGENEHGFNLVSKSGFGG